MEVHWQENEVCEIYVDLARITNKINKLQEKSDLYISCLNQGLALEREKNQLRIRCKTGPAASKQKVGVLFYSD